MVDTPPNFSSQVRLNIAFENMIVCVLIGAAASGAFNLLVDLAGVLVAGELQFGAVLKALFQSVYVSFLTFLLGFIVAVVVMTPLFSILEKEKYRRVWPFAVAALAMEMLIATVFFNGAPFVDLLHIKKSILAFAPGVLMAILFGRRMTPLWRAAEKAEQEARAARAATDFFRLH